VFDEPPAARGVFMRSESQFATHHRGAASKLDLTRNPNCLRPLVISMRMRAEAGFTKSPDGKRLVDRDPALTRAGAQSTQCACGTVTCAAVTHTGATGHHVMKHLASTITRKAWQPLFDFLSKDRLTGQKLAFRNDLQHLGSQNGGWMVPTRLLRPNAICYCVGCGEDISFDLALIREFSCKVYAFDPTPRAIKHVADQAGSEPDYHFSAVGLWSQEDTLKFYAPRNPAHVSHSVVNLQNTSDYFEARVARLSDLLVCNGHRSVDLLKLDIEGAEYTVIESIITDGIAIGILCVEFDEYFNPLDRLYKDRISQSIAGLIRAGFVLVCAEGNGNYTFVHEAASDASTRSQRTSK
jgi:FkbM family methyltransferase